MQRRTGLTPAEQLAIRPIAWLAEKLEQGRDADGNWTVRRGVWRTRQYRDLNEALDAAGAEGEIEFRSDYGVVFAGHDPLARDKAAKYEAEHRARMAAERRRRQRLSKWLRARRRGAVRAAERNYERNAHAETSE
ncbi:MAG: hypothetical protein AB7Q42_05980 [Acidimicrobiia bacterium]